MPAEHSDQLPEVTARRTLARGRRFEFQQLTVRRPGGATHELEIVRHPGAVVILPILPGGDLVMIRVWRAAVARGLLEFPAGTLEAGESPERCAARELIEETGYRGGRLVALGSFHTTPGLTDELMHAFAALEPDAGAPAPEADENIRLVRVAAGEVMRLVDRGELQDGKSLAVLLLAWRRGLVDLGAARAPGAR
ncbi:MAG TPA: NUDIX hydrolase [Phycisphaerales bacterium]|nr:NUDIX hydrolase [Phycisphaerales bacterium]